MTASAQIDDAPPFRTIAEMIGEHAARAPGSLAFVLGERALDYRGLDALMDRTAAALQRDGVQPRETIAIVAGTSIEYAAVFLGALRAGVAVAPLPPSSTADSLNAMIADSAARLVFVDGDAARLLDGAGGPAPGAAPRVTLDGSAAGRALEAWLAPQGARPSRVEIEPDWPFNVIYSSGTTGTPKGIVQSHAMRWRHVALSDAFGYGPSCVTLLSTPLYSNTTLVSFFPTVSRGGATVLMAKFDALEYLKLAQRHRVTHTMLVPVQYRRLIAHPEFDRFDLSAFQLKCCTSAPFHAELKAEVLRRWPGGLVEFYGMTEGGGGCMLVAHEHPDKLHTVGQPLAGNEVRLIDEQDRFVPVGEAGEVIGRSLAMMTGYLNQPGKTREAEWYDAQGGRWIRTGDIGRFDEDGFLTLFDRRKDMIISGGFNVYPSDLEAVLRAHPRVADVAVVGVPSEQWGETPVAFVVPAEGPQPEPEEIRAWANAQLGKTQRLAAVRLTDALPRSAIGKVLKRELRDAYAAQEAARR